MKKLFIEWYGDQKFIAVSKLKIAEYYAKQRIEGDNWSTLYESIKLNGVKKPIVINTYPGREGIIIDGVEVFRISKELGIYDIPCHDLYVDIEKEKECHHLLSIHSNEYPIERIIDFLLNKPYSEYFQDLDQPLQIHNEVFEAGSKAHTKSIANVQHRKHSFLLRYDDAQKGYLDTLVKMLGAKSQNEALLMLLMEFVEGRIAL